MEPTPQKIPLLLPFLLFNFLFLLSISSDPQHYRTFTLSQLPAPPTHQLPLSFPPQLTSLQPDPQSTLSLSLPLHNIDSLSTNQTAQSLFTTRLTRDAIRVDSISIFTSALINKTTPHAHVSRRGSTDFSSSIISGLSQGSGEYFTRLGVGTPPRYSYMVLDTGSDIIWLQCRPCRKCYTQSDPIFDPKRSSTFTVQPCGSPLCRNLDVSGCSQQKACLYQVSYGDGSFTVGDYATETLTFRGTKVPRVGFGCGHDNEGLFVGAAGLLGLGRGKSSFPIQIGSRFGNKFSYCLVDRMNLAVKPSAIVFGESAVSRSAVYTPMLKNPKLDTFYYLQLIGISVGGTRVAGITTELFQLDSAGNGGVIIDSGTSVTRLTRLAYIKLRDAFRATTAGLKRAPDFSLFDTCYDLTGKTEVKVPTVVMHFANGADVSLPGENYLIAVDTSGTFCFAFAGTSGGLSIIGNIQQQGFRVVFDNAGQRIGFAPHGCA